MNIAAECGNLLHRRRTEISILQRGDQKNSIDLGSKDPVRLCHLQLVFKISDRAKPPHNGAGVTGFCKIHSQSLERSHFHARDVFCRFPKYINTFFRRKQRRFCRIMQNSHIQVAKRHRVKSSRIDSYSHSLSPSRRRKNKCPFVLYFFSFMIR